MSTMTPSAKTDLYGVVDMGSNGIRFSITDLSPPSARILPTVFYDRAGISLNDAQFTSDGQRCPIPPDTIDRVVARLLRFKITCQDFGVPQEKIYVLATEATRTASNSRAFRDKIKAKTGWEIKLLSKEEEGWIGSVGVASSGRGVKGLVMELGGGSVQFSWVAQKDGVIETCATPFSFPYGAATLMKRLKGEPKEDIKEQMKGEFRRAFHQLDLPEDLKKGTNDLWGLDLYLTGGGFRGWGYLLMSRATVGGYPIPIINGYRVNNEEFQNTGPVLSAVSKGDVKVLGVSKRRASQTPAIALLVDAVVDALPMIKNIQFSQAGIREGFLFNKLPAELRAYDPLLVATLAYAPSSREDLKTLLQSALPATASPLSYSQVPNSISATFLEGLANLLFAHANVPKEARAAAALHSTTTGILASANGLTHTDRALLALTLCERWGGDLISADELFHGRLVQCVSAQETWWARYLGRVARMIGDVHPSGVIPERWRIQLETKWDCIVKKNERCDLLRLAVRCDDSDPTEAAVMREILMDCAERIEKIAKKKKWIEGYGVRVGVAIQ